MDFLLVEPHPQAGLDVIAEAVARNKTANSSRILALLVKSTYWYVPSDDVAQQVARKLGDTQLLKLLILPGGTNLVIGGLFDLYLRHYFREKDIVRGTLFDSDIEIRQAPISQGLLPITEQQLDPRYALNLLQRAAQNQNWVLVRQLLINWCIRAPYLLAQPLVSVQHQVWQSQLLRLYQDLGLLDQTLANTIVVVNDNYVSDQAIAPLLDVNRLLSFFLNPDKQKRWFVSRPVRRLDPISELLIRASDIDPALLVRVAVAGYLRGLLNLTSFSP